MQSLRRPAAIAASTIMARYRWVPLLNIQKTAYELVLSEELKIYLTSPKLQCLSQRPHMLINGQRRAQGGRLWPDPYRDRELVPLQCPEIDRRPDDAGNRTVGPRLLSNYRLD